MSVVVRECQNGKIFLLSKGADEAILLYASAGNFIYWSYLLLVWKDTEKTFYNTQCNSTQLRSCPKLVEFSYMDYFPPFGSILLNM